MKDLSVNKISIKDILEQVTPVKEYEKGDTIYYQGDKATCFYYLKKGRVRVYMISADGMEKTLSTATAGEILGEAAFFDKLPRISFCKAMTNIKVVAINKQKLLDIIKKYPTFALELLEIQGKRVRQLSTQIDAMTFMQADGRIAQLLIQNAVANGNKVKLTHQEIASTVGVSRVTVSKILQSFVRKGFVKTEYGYIVIKDIKCLREIVNR